MSFGPPRHPHPRSCGKKNNRATNVGKSTERNKIFSSTFNSNANSSDATLVSCDISEIQNDCKKNSTTKLKDSRPEVLKNECNLSPEEKQDILNTQLIQLMYALEIQSESQKAMKEKYEAQIADLKLKENEVTCQEISVTEWVQNVHNVCREVVLLGKKETQFIELFDEAKKLEDLLSELSSGVRKKFSQLHINHVAMNTASYDAFLHGLIEMSNTLHNTIEISKGNCGHLDTVKDVQQLLSKIIHCSNQCLELMKSGYDKMLDVLFQKTLLNDCKVIN